MLVWGKKKRIGMKRIVMKRIGIKRIVMKRIVMKRIVMKRINDLLNVAKGIYEHKLW